MQLKSYFAGTVEAAMELARLELEKEALLATTHPVAPEARYSPPNARIRQRGEAESDGSGPTHGPSPAALRFGLYEVGMASSHVTREAFPNPSQERTGRPQALAAISAPLNPLLKSLLSKQRAAA